VKGLKNAGHGSLAMEIAQRWITTVEVYYRQNGKIMEKYDVCAPMSKAGGGEYAVQEGFGWTNGVTSVFYRSLD
jgi:alpha,alpha-trehalase